jgi:hypothetical protein
MSYTKSYTYRIKRRTFVVTRCLERDRSGYPAGWLVVEHLPDGWHREVARGLTTLREAKAAAELEVQSDARAR